MLPSGCESGSVWLRAGRPGFRGSIPGRSERIFPLASVSRPALGPTQPPAQRVPGVLSRGKTRPGRDADHSPHPVPRSRISRSYIASPPSASVAYSGTTFLPNGLYRCSSDVWERYVDFWKLILYFSAYADKQNELNTYSYDDRVCSHL
jgi:hypothetical protein